MKKILFILIILLISTSLFAEFRLGPAIGINFPLIADNEYNPPELTGADFSDFTFGLDARLKVLFFQAGTNIFLTPGVTKSDAKGSEITLPASVDIFLDAGIALDLLFFRFGLGAGPNFTFFFKDTPLVSDTSSMGFNLKGSVDLVLGPVSLGIFYLNQFDFDLDHPTSVLSADKTQGILGLAVLFKL